MKISLIICSFNRPNLLDLGLWSLTQQIINHDLEIIVCNDYIPDDTEIICNKYKSKLNIRYFFIGQRNINEIKWRSAGFALNIATKLAMGKVLILTCPEIVHLNNTIELIINPLMNDKKIISIGESVFFDDTGNTVNYLKENHNLNLPEELLKEIQRDPECKMAVKMPYLMGIFRQEYLDIGGYDEDFTGWACEDNDFTNRLLLNGLKYYRTKAQIIHLYHGNRCDSKVHWNNPKWVYNYNLFLERKNKIIRNQNREWGKIDGN